MMAAATELGEGSVVGGHRVTKEDLKRGFFLFTKEEKKHYACLIESGCHKSFE